MAVWVHLSIMLTWLSGVSGIGIIQTTHIIASSMQETGYSLNMRVKNFMLTFSLFCKGRQKVILWPMFYEELYVRRFHRHVSWCTHVAPPMRMELSL